MKESVSSAGMTTKSQLDHYYRWVEPDSDITVCLNAETVDRLQLEILRNVDFSSHAAIEVGGILFGRMERSEGRKLVFVEDFEPVPREHRNGPSYSLTARDVAVFEAALARSGGRQTLHAVGYFRSHNRDGLFLSADDLRLIHRHFSGPDNLFLIIKTLANRACTAGFFFWKHGHIQAEFTDSEAPFIPISLSLADRSLSLREAGGDNPVAPVAIAPPELGPSRRLSRRVVRAMMLTGIAAAFTFAVVRYRGTAQDQAPRASRSAPTAVANSTPPASTRVLGPTPVLEQSGGIIPHRPLKTPGLPETVLPQARNEPAIPLRDESKPPAPAPAVDLPAVRVAVAGEPIAPPLPTPSTATAEHPPNAAETMVVAQVPVTPPPQPQNPVTPAIEAARTDATTSVAPPVSAPPPPASSAATAFVSPQVVHQVTPAVPRGIGPMITTDVQIDVAVVIDTSGKVISARVASARGAGAGLLTIEALKAAQLFRFRPATENGRNVASGLVLTFRFARTAK